MANYSLAADFFAEEQVQRVAQLADANPRLPVYRLHFPVAEEGVATAQAWARKLFVDTRFGDARPESTAHAGRLVLRHPDGYRIRLFYPSNWLEFNDTRRAFSGSTDVTQIDAADTLVREFIGRHQLLPAEWERQVRVDALRLLHAQGVSEDRMSEPTVINAFLSYQRVTGDIGWIGPGSRIVATIAQRSVVGFDRPWREFDPAPATMVDIRPVQEVVEELADRLAALHGKPLPRGAVRLEGIEFGYYAMGKHTQQRFLQPAYELKYRTMGPINAALSEVIPAHKVDIEALVVPPAVSRPPQKHRPAVDCTDGRSRPC